ncbi:MAG TPA: GNAT family N-acetyltransferase [Candidatus Polarisedimenticolia bacterium]|nr:GNAT family N-acetyltransferase [Candidatus Polarisedimenticolia bacterium]
MPDAPTPASVDRDLARRIEAAEATTAMLYAETLKRLRPGTAAVAERIAGGAAVYAGIGSPLTRAGGLGLEGPVTVVEIERLEQFYRSRGIEARLEVSPLADPSLFDLLGRRGYRLTGFSNLLARPLVRGDAPLPAPSSGVSTRRVTPEGAETWARTVAQGFFDPEPVSPALMGTFAPFCELPGATCFLALVDDRVAGGGALAIQERVAILLGGSTLAPCRGRGAHSALILARLALAVERGCDLATLSASPGGVAQRNAERLGFRVLYTRARMALDHRGGGEILLHY